MTKRNVRRAPRPRRAQPPSRPMTEAMPAPPQPAAAPAASAVPADLGSEYRYVISDLKRIAIVAASMFALLTVLALIIT